MLVIYAINMCYQCTFILSMYVINAFPIPHFPLPLFSSGSARRRASRWSGAPSTSRTRRWTARVSGADCICSFGVWCRFLDVIRVWYLLRTLFDHFSCYSRCLLCTDMRKYVAVVMWRSTFVHFSVFSVFKLIFIFFYLFLSQTSAERRSTLLSTARKCAISPPAPATPTCCRAWPPLSRSSCWWWA